MRIGVGQISQVDDRYLRFAAQIGASGVVINTPALPWDGGFATHDLRRVREQIETHDLRLEAIENVPLGAYRDVIVGGPASDEQTAHYCQTIRNLGAAGIDTLGLHWMTDGVWRTAEARVRGDARATAFSLESFSREVEAHPEVDTRATLIRFLRKIVPVAESAGVRLALHPDDPPLPAAITPSRVLSSREDFERVLSEIPSPALGVNFCLGTFTEMGGTPLATLERFVTDGRVVYAHFRNVVGSVPSFAESFIDDGDVDIAEALAILMRSSFDGCVIDDHVPHLDGETSEGGAHPDGWQYRGHAHATGFLQGAVAALRLSSPPGRSDPSA
jgi:mannonate dehydratase